MAYVCPEQCQTWECFSLMNKVKYVFDLVNGYLGIIYKQLSQRELLWMVQWSTWYSTDNIAIHKSNNSFTQNTLTRP